VLGRAATAVDACSSWELAPRYGFLSDFAPGEPDPAERLAAMARYHLNAVQFYDWMYRHHRFLPPQPEFTDPLGRRLSLATVRRKIDAARRLGMRAMAYATVYAAAPEYFAEHRDQALYDSRGQPFMLGDFLNIMNVADPAWREQLVGECRAALRELPFDGIHLDQYGSPHTGYTLDGRRVDVEQELPGLLDAVRAGTGDAPTVFNAVNGWPLEAVARSPVEPLYIEVWPPNDTYRDLRELILRARDLRGGRAPVLAAYLSEFYTPERAEEAGAAPDFRSLGDFGSLREGAGTALRRLTAALALHGASHIVLGEGDGVLCHPYFPNYARLAPEEAAAVRRDYDFLSRYLEYFFDPGWRDVSATRVGGINETIRLDAPRYGPYGLPDSLWTVVRQRGDELTLGLVNLRDTGPLWNAAQPAPPPVHDLALALRVERPVASLYYASPDYAGGRPIRLATEGDARSTRAVLPELRLWGLVIARLG
jgi:dextranase